MDKFAYWFEWKKKSREELEKERERLLTEFDFRTQEGVWADPKVVELREKIDVIEGLLARQS